MRKISYILSCFVVLICPLSAWSSGNTQKQSEPAQAAKQQKIAPVPIEDLQRFTTAIDMIRNYYVSDVNEGDLFEHAISGMVSGLDPHSSYYNKEDFQDLQISTSGQFVGIGIKVTTSDGFIKVISPIDDSPASKAGIKPGDIIIRIDDAAVQGMSLRKAVDLMRGKLGETVNLTILRQTEKKPLVLKVVRDEIKTKSVKSKLLGSNFGVIRVAQFQSSTPKEFRQAITDLQKSATPKLEGIILDLRNNPGGILDACVEISSAMLDSKNLGNDKLIVFAKGKSPGSYLAEKATSTDLLNGLPLVVLVNEGSASASEIVAGALQDHGRALIVGTRTFGKGSVQTVLPLSGKHGIKLTTALYYTPKGRSIQAEGIKPDIEIKQIDIAKPTQKTDDADQIVFRESDYDRHLQQDNSYFKSADKLPNNKNDDDQPLIYSDYQLYQALLILQGINKMHEV